MKTSTQLLSFLFATILSVSIYSQASAQSCYVVKDSTIMGNGAGSYSDYVVDAIGRTVQAYFTDSGNVTGPSTAVVVIIDAGTNLPAELRFTNTGGTPVVNKILRNTYANGKIVSVFDSTGNGTMTHTISYDGSGKIQSVLLTNMTGNPDGFNGSFKDFIWQNGNISSMKLLVGGDSLQLSLFFDTKNNIFKKLLNTEGASNIFQAANNNNIDSIVTTAPATVGGNAVPVGTKAIDRRFTYNTNNDVVTLQELPSLFDNNTRTTQYFWDCSVGIPTINISGISFYPNPTSGAVSIENGHFEGTIMIFDIKGKEVKKIQTDVHLSTINIGELLPGIYYLEMIQGDNVFRGKILKN